VSDLKELFDMVTTQTEPDVDAWRELERRQRRRANGRRAAAFTVAAAVAIGAIIAAVVAQGGGPVQPLDSSTPPPVVSTGASLVAIDVATGVQTALIPDVAAFRPAVSPDGMQIAFERSVRGKTQIFLAGIDGTNAQQLTGRKGQAGCGCGAFDPTWSPDGTQVAYSGTNGFGNRGIYVMTLATGKARLLTHESGDSFEVSPAWSPGGAQIAYAAGGWQEEPAGSGLIYVTPVAGRRPPFLLIADRNGAVDPSWGPDRSSIVFTADVRGGTALFTASTDVNVEPRRLTDATEDSSPAWSPDGTQVAFVRGTDVAVLTVATGEVRILGTGGDPAWSPDGSTIYAWRA
jgi:Tol biopolymer transport system component